VADSIATTPAAGGPYGASALAYWSAGWQGVLPLPAGRKWPPPPGWTGYDGEYPSHADVQTWLDDERTAGGNVALRLPRDVLGLDVDAYPGKAGGRTLVDLTERLGPLPPTWSTTARDDGVSGIRLYRVTGSAVGGHWKGEAGPGIEVIAWGHRYAIVPPSVNPDAAGAPYRWRMAGTVGPAEIDRAPQHPGELPELPAAWVAYLLIPGERRVGAELDDESARTWLAACRGLHAGESGCPIVERTAAGVALGVGSRHEAARDAVHALARLGGEGHAGVWAALVRLRERFVEALEGERGRDAAGEWRRMLSGAVRLAAGSDREPRGSCGCATWAGELVGFDPGFPGEGGAGVEGGEDQNRTAPNTPNGESVEAGGPVDPVDVMEAELLTAAQLDELPNPVPLIDGLLDLNSLAWLIGKPGSFKSFLALTLAGHVGRGLMWAGAKVRQGEVIYLVAEGVQGTKLRKRAWEKHYGTMEGVRFLPRPVQVDSQEWVTLSLLVQRRAPVLVIVDTQARVSVGIKESDNAEMGRFIERVDWLRRLAGCCVLVVHHIGRVGMDARGASAIDGAQDTELRIERVGGPKSRYAKVVTDKQKDRDDTTEILLELAHVDGGTDPDTGRDLSSLVAMPPAFAMPPSRPWRDDLPANQQRIVDVLGEHTGMLGGTRAEVRALVTERFGAMTRSSFSTAFTRLAEMGVITRIEGTERWCLSSVIGRTSLASPDSAAELAKFFGTD